MRRNEIITIIILLMPIVLLGITKEITFDKNDVIYNDYYGYYTLKTCDIYMEKDNPILPYKTVNFKVTGKVKNIKVIPLDSIIIGNYKSYPVIENSSLDMFEIKRTENIEYNTLYKTVGYGYVRNNRIFSLNIFPIQLKNNKIILYTKIEISFTTNYEETKNIKESSLSDKIFQSYINDITEQTNTTKNPYYSYSSNDYLHQTIDEIIITHPDFKEYADELKFHEIMKGYNTKVITTDFIYENYSGHDKPEKIRNCIKDYYENYSTAYVTIIGDVEYVPIRESVSNSFYYSGRVAAEMYYTMLDGDENGNRNSEICEIPPSIYYNPDSVDLYPDIIVGRIPVNNTDMMKAYLNKLAIFENPQNYDIKKALFIGSSISTPTDGYGQINDEYIINAYIPSYFSTQEVYNPIADTTYNRWSGDILLNTESALNALSGEYQIVGHIDHCYFTWMGSGLKTGGGTIMNSFINDLTNPFPYVLYSMGCSSNAFDYESISEEFIENTHGAIAYIGYTRTAYTGQVAQMKEFFNQIFQGKTIGEGFFYSITKAYAPYQRYNLALLGLPTIKIWTNDPIRITITNTNFSNDTLCISLISPQPTSATLTTYIEDQYFNRTEIYCEDSSTIKLPIRTNGGKLYIGISGQNIITTIDSIYVNPSDKIEFIKNDDINYYTRQYPYYSFTSIFKSNFSPSSVNVVLNDTSYYRLDRSYFTTSNDTVYVVSSIEFKGNPPTNYVLPVTFEFTGTDTENIKVNISCGGDSIIVKNYKYSYIYTNDNNSIAKNTLTYISDIQLINKSDKPVKKGRISITSTNPYTNINPPSSLFSSDYNDTIIYIENMFEISATDNHIVTNDTLIFTITTETGYYIEDTLYNIPINGIVSASYSFNDKGLKLEWQTTNDPSFEYLSYYRVFREENGEIKDISGKIDSKSPYFMITDNPDTITTVYTIKGYNERDVEKSMVKVTVSPTFMIKNIITGLEIPYGGRYHYQFIKGRGSSVVEDIDNDGLKEFIFADNKGLVHVIDNNGNERENFPVKTDKHSGELTPLVCDLYGNGEKEIIVLAGEDDSTFIYVFNANGDTVWTVKKPWISRLIADPVAYDIDEDGKDEIMAGFSSRIYIYEDSASLKKYIQFPATVMGFALDKTKDGFELIVSLSNKNICIYNLSSGDTTMIAVGDNLLSSAPAVGDIDGDNKNEIVVQTYSHTVLAFEKDGTLIDGFPITIAHEAWDSPVLADINNDGKKEILAYPVSDYLYAIDYQGNILWTKQFSTNSSYYNAPIVGDFNNDGNDEIIYLSGDGTVYMLNGNGETLLSRKIGCNIMTSPAIADIDNDGREELAVKTNGGKFIVVTIPYKENKADTNEIEWAMAKNNIYHTNSIFETSYLMMPFPKQTLYNNNKTVIRFSSNLVSDYLAIDFSRETEDINIKIYDITGRKVKEINKDKAKRVDIDTSNIPAGKYIVFAKDKETSVSKSVIKVK